MSIETNNHDELAERIRVAVLARKDVAEHGEHFIVPWQTEATHDLHHGKGLAECGCGISQDDPPPR
jgi:hypothetical protein